MPLEAELVEEPEEEELLEEELVEVLEEALLEEVFAEPPSALALTAVPVDLPPRKNLGDLEEALFS